MKKILVELFNEAKGPTVEYEGLIVHGIVFKYVTKPGRYMVRFMKGVSKPPQGIGIAINKGELTVEDTTAKRIALWYDYCPEVVEVTYRPPRDGGRLSIYNIWENEGGGIEAWIMHAGMLVEESGNKMILRCSDGRGEPTFDDLIVEIEFLDD